MKLSTRRGLKGLLFAVTGLLVGFVIAGYVLLQRSLPPTNGTISIDGLHHEVTITFDSLGVPQIWARSETDALFALGFQHAADRMFQMDLIRRLAQGRLSEMLGSLTLETDKRQRTIGHTRLAQRALAELSDQNRLRLQAYADGINAYYANCGAVPFEYRLLPTDFETWTVYDCLAILSFQTWFSDALQNNDEFYLELSDQLDDEQFQSLLPVYPTWAPPTVPEENVQSVLPDPGESAGSMDEQQLVTTDHRATPPPATDSGPCEMDSKDWPPASRSSVFQKSVATELLAGLSAPFHMTGASNSWVVAPSRARNRRAMLAADPHLEIGRLPQFWYAVGLHVADSAYGVLGLTVPGLPFVVMGHNGAVAWSFTAGGVDVTDYYEERRDPVDSTKLLTPFGYEPFDVVIDTIYTSDSSVVEHRTRLTRNRPITIDQGNRLYSLRWAGYDADFDAAVTAGFDLHRTTGFEQFRSTATKLGALNANYMYADSNGNIGYQLATPLPLRPHDGRRAGRGWIGEDDWQGYYPLSWTPHTYNPQQGWLASCNNRPSRQPYVRGNFAADRILRITDLLTSNDDVIDDDLAAWQMDLRDEYLLRWRSVLGDALDRLGEKETADLVRNWDGVASVESTVMPLVVTWLERLERLTFEDELGGMYSHVSMLTLDRLYHDSTTRWFDDVATEDQVETRDDITLQAARETVEAMNIGDSTGTRRTWGEMHTLSMNHLMGSVPILNSILALRFGPWPHAGSKGALNASFFRRRSDTAYTCVVGPSWRFVIDFADIDAATMVLPAGNSGNPVSRHFFDFNDRWRSGERWNVPFSRERVFERTVSVLTMQPNDSP